MKNEQGREEKIRFIIENPFTHNKLGVEIGDEEYPWHSPDFIFNLNIMELEILIEKLTDLRKRFLEEFK